MHQKFKKFHIKQKPNLKAKSKNLNIVYLKNVKFDQFVFHLFFPSGLSVRTPRQRRLERDRSKNSFLLELLKKLKKVKKS